jgi:tRNA U34 5-methylaminomethyl-2-thiouridine-forming methyltransferase MnmC
MHPSVGPWKEANLLYVKQLQLEERLRSNSQGRTSGQNDQPLLDLSERCGVFRIWDVGLGAGTNAVAALSAAQAMGAERQRPLEVVSFERTRGPLELALSDLEGFPYLRPWREAAEAVLREGRWESRGLVWKWVAGELPGSFEGAPHSADLIFFDPFSPETNPLLWTPTALSTLRLSAGEAEAGTLLATYSASTRTRVSLLLAGFFVGVGVAVGNRRETTVAATRLELLAEPLGQRWLERWRRSVARAPYGHTEIPNLTLHPQFAKRLAPGGG